MGHPSVRSGQFFEVPTFTDEPLDREGIYWEHVGNRAVRSGDWKLVETSEGEAYLFDLASAEVPESPAGETDQ